MIEGKIIAALEAAIKRQVVACADPLDQTLPNITYQMGVLHGAVYGLREARIAVIAVLNDNEVKDAAL